MHQSSPDRPLTRAKLVIGVYGAMALLAILIMAGRGITVGAPVPGYWADGLLWSPLAGLALGWGFALGTRYAVAHWQWASGMQAAFRDRLGPLTGRDIALLAITSAVGEELLFRGALLPWIGLVPQALVFGVLHIGPSTRLLPWTASALVMGLVFGLLTIASGNLLGATVAHAVINGLNLRLIIGSASEELSCARFTSSR